MAEFRKNLPIKDIKSIYINQEIFSFLDKKLLLKLIINNKYLQNKLGISIIEYAAMAGKYKIAEKNGIGKIYDLEADKLIFDGEYLNGKKNGKGKEYNIYGELEFEGEYLDGKRHRKGKEYKYGKLIFEGKYNNGKKWNGKLYNDGFLEYEIITGNGKIKDYYSNNALRFEGELVNGVRHGKGKEYYDNNEIKFEGEYSGGKRNGKGK